MNLNGIIDYIISRYFTVYFYVGGISINENSVYMEYGFAEKCLFPFLREPSYAAMKKSHYKSHNREFIIYYCKRMSCEEALQLQLANEYIVKDKKKIKASDLYPAK